ncbi:MAG: hypothetical protein C4308_12325 [Chitinophagaceae bacterium]
MKSTTLEKIFALSIKKLVFSSAFFLFSFFCFAQDNSPYSRYGLGDVLPQSNMVNRAMGGISAAAYDPLSINFNNPATYSGFLYTLEPKSKKLTSGRVVLNVGVNFQSHTLREPNNPEKFTSSDAVFSYLQVGMPLKKNWGISFGLRQISRIGYKIADYERLMDPVTGNIDSSLTEYSGDGGTFLANAGTGFAIKNFRLGFNFGYLFGKKETTTRRFFINDTVYYKSGKYITATSFGNLFFSAGAQYKIDLKKNFDLTLGAYGNLKQTLNASQNLSRETFVGDPDNGDITIDSVYKVSNVSGKVVYPSQFGGGLVLRKMDKSSWFMGVDYVRSNWSQYRFYGLKDRVENSSQLHIGGELTPEPKEKKYFSHVSYRAGVFFGNDYINVDDKHPVFGITAGARFPIATQRSSNQFSIINLSVEYIRRGNNSSVLKENLLRVGVGLSFSDLWFIKRKYD